MPGSRSPKAGRSSYICSLAGAKGRHMLKDHKMWVPGVCSDTIASLQPRGAADGHAEPPERHVRAAPRRAPLQLLRQCHQSACAVARARRLHR